MNRDKSLVPYDPEINASLRQLKKSLKSKEPVVVVDISSTQFASTCATSSSFTGDICDHHFIMAEVRQPNGNGNGGDENHHEVPYNVLPNAEDDTRSIREINHSTVHGAPGGMQSFDLGFEIKGSLISSLPKFHGLAGDDAFHHIDLLYCICGSMKPAGANLEDVLRCVFHFTLDGNARSWLFTLPQHYSTLTWEDLKDAFLSKFCPASRTSRLKKEIYGVFQYDMESLYDYWTRFLALLSKCRNHQCSKANLVQYFYDGLSVECKEKVDQASNGSLLELTPNKAWSLLETMATNNQQYYTRDYNRMPTSSSKPQDTLSLDLGHKLDKILANQQAFEVRLSNFEKGGISKPCNVVSSSQALVAPSCNLCASPMHLSEDCPSHFSNVNAMYPNRFGQGNFGQNQYTPRPPFTPYNSNTFNSRGNNDGWRGGDTHTQEQGNSRALVPMNGPSTHQEINPNDMFKRFNDGLSSLGNDWSNQLDASIAKLNGTLSTKIDGVASKVEQQEAKYNTLASHMTQLADALSNMQAKFSNSLPASTVINPSHTKSVNSISLRSGKQVHFKDSVHEVGEPSNVKSSSAQDLVGDETDDDIEEIVVESPPTPKVVHSESLKEQELAIKKTSAQAMPSNHETKKDFKISDLPFPNAFIQDQKKKNEQNEQDAYNLFSKIEVNVPLLEYLKTTPKYLRFLKELCTTKRKCKPNELVQVGSNVSAIFQPQLAVKCTDPGSFTVPCTVGSLNIPHALLDLGAAINVMPLSVFKTLKCDNNNALLKTTMKIRLADQTVREPIGLLEDVLVKVKNLVFPVDFYVMDTSRGQDTDLPLILGRPFMRTANTIVSLKDGCISMQVGGNVIRFNVYETMRHPFEDYSLLDVNQIDSIEEEVTNEYALSLIEEKHNDFGSSFPCYSYSSFSMEPHDDFSLMANADDDFLDDLIENHDIVDDMVCTKSEIFPCMSIKNVSKRKRKKKKKGVQLDSSVSQVTTNVPLDSNDVHDNSKERFGHHIEMLSQSLKFFKENFKPP